MAEQNPAAQDQNFNLKNVEVALIPKSRRAPADISVQELERLRVNRPAIPASKNGLEVICGASCEIGAH